MSRIVVVFRIMRQGRRPRATWTDHTHGIQTTVTLRE